MLGKRPIASAALASLVGQLTPNPPTPPNPPQPQPLPRPGVQPAEPVIQLDQSGRLQQLQWVGLGPTKGPIIHDEPATIEYYIDGGGQGLVLGISGFLTIPNWLLIQSWSIIATNTGSLVVDVWKLPLSSMIAGTPLSVANSICASAKPTLTGALISQGPATGWDSFILQNDVLGFNIDSATNLTHATIILHCLEVKLQ